MVKKDNVIVCIIQVYNEMKTGHIKEFFKYAPKIADHIVVYDDGSTDGTWEYCQEQTPYVIRCSENNFKGELGHRRKLLEYATKLNADFIINHDADEILLLSKSDLIKKCSEMAEQGYDGIRVDFINLWRSKSYKRTDSLFNEIKPVKIWRHCKHLDPFPHDNNTLHQVLHPVYVKKILEDYSIKIIHTGFSTIERIARKFLIYQSHGQKGFNLMRFIDESKLNLQKVNSLDLPSDYQVDEPMPGPLSIREYTEKIIQIKNEILKPKFSIICLIYKDLNWLNFVYEQVQKNTKLIDKEFFFVANNATEEVKKHLKENYIPHFVFDTTDEQKNEYYINNVYRAYNYGVKMAKGDFVVLINSDMAFTPSWFENLYNKYNGRNCVASRLVEAGRLTPGKYGISKNFGNDFNDYSENDFLNYAKVLSEESLMEGGLFMPLLIRKDHFFSAGGYPEGNVLKGSDIFNPKIASPGDELISGDTIFIQKLKSIGIEHGTSFNSIVYHFQEGEKRSNSLELYKEKVNREIAVCNDIVTGSMGEKVLWDYLLELPKTVGVDFKKAGGRKSISFQSYFKENDSNVDIIIQNATFLDFLDPARFTIAFLQDDLRKMNNPSHAQEYILKNADICVTNSIETAASYPEFSFELIPVGVDSEKFRPLNKKDLRLKWGFNLNKKTGIFVGALNEVKGWSKILDCIENEPDFNWIIVSKYNEEFKHPRVKFYNRVNQEILAELLNCADFFILGSRVETQCLAAIEAALCDLPIIMNKTGIFNEIGPRDLEKIGIFDEPFRQAIKHLDNKTFSPRKIMLSKPVTINECKKNWHILLSQVKSRIINNRFQEVILEREESQNVSFLTNTFLGIEFFFRRRILLQMIGRDYFFNFAEITVALKKVLPTYLFQLLRGTWRLRKIIVRK